VPSWPREMIWEHLVWNFPRKKIHIDDSEFLLFSTAAENKSEKSLLSKKTIAAAPHHLSILKYQRVVFREQKPQFGTH
jgi:sulfur relay (sulfurtransferase) DsrC/TusE family protein